MNLIYKQPYDYREPRPYSIETHMSHVDVGDRGALESVKESLQEGLERLGRFATVLARKNLLSADEIAWIVEGVDCEDAAFVPDDSPSFTAK